MDDKSGWPKIYGGSRVSRDGYYSVGFKCHIVHPCPVIPDKLLSRAGFRIAGKRRNARSKDHRKVVRIPAGYACYRVERFDMDGKIVMIISERNEFEDRGITVLCPDSRCRVFEHGDIFEVPVHRFCNIRCNTGSPSQDVFMVRIVPLNKPKRVAR